MASPIQFSVRQMLLAVAFVAIGIAALRNANSYWMSAVWGVVTLLLAVAILLVIFRRGSSQAFWIGFAVFGGMYAVIVMTANLMAENLVPLAHPTTQLTDWAYAMVIPEAEREPEIANPDFKGDPSAASGFGRGFPGGGFSGIGSGFGPGAANDVRPTITNPDYVDAITFRNIGHALWLVILAALGGKLAQWIYKTGVRNQESGVNGS